ncbi:substrate-binding domain-containing protein [Enterovibrio nigricans]|uniref:Tungstate transport system substrate-binding protein n=1 Tax=Enterovibrio nigricans DSM 22720 TaxID=1121868 RepID=A0A1T4UAR5_9GAMM|nr:substrate-binding domain-containing protein [Enterovibrio nigricans]SKA49804.1 tungstate transport system substrate-binding protein [Enterovibrio nigricans DSM 22720]
MRFINKTKTLFLLAIALTFSVTSNAAEIVRLATTTSTYHSGLLGFLLPEFKKDTGYDVQVMAAGTGKALKMGENGDVDVVMTHAPNAEAAFVQKGFGVQPRAFMYNDFVLVGPKNDPAAVRGSKDITDALKNVAMANAEFVSRGDDSGTHKKELLLWKASGSEPSFSQYKAIGQGMGPTLTMANELLGYTLTDRGTWLAYQSKLDLVVLVEGDSRLFNPYQVILINPDRYPDLNSKGVRALSDWLVDKRAQSLIDSYKVNGQQLFVADAG